MKLLSMNIWGGRMVFSLPRFIQEQSADIVCMQEVNNVPGEMGGVFESLQTIQAACGFDYSFMASDLSYAYQNRTAEYGNAMLSNRNLMDQEIVFVQGVYTRNYDDAKITGDHPRNFQHATILVADTLVHIINFHGAFIPGTKDGNADTLGHINKLATYARQFTDEPVIITGDFNLTPKSESIKVLNNEFRNLSVEYNIASTYSSKLHVFDVVCDYIFVNKHVDVTSFDVLDTIVSDHRALILEFDV